MRFKTAVALTIAAAFAMTPAVSQAWCGPTSCGVRHVRVATYPTAGYAYTGGYHYASSYACNPCYRPVASYCWPPCAVRCYTPCRVCNPCW